MTILEAYKKIVASDDLKNGLINAYKAKKINEFLKENDIEYTVEQFRDYIKNNKNEIREVIINRLSGGKSSIDSSDTLFKALDQLLDC